MNSQYKIGDISRLFNLSSEMIRYYEKMGIIDPIRDEKNGYRYYSIFDIYILLECLQYQNLGMKIKEIPNFINFNYSWEFFLYNASTERYNMYAKKCKYSMNKPRYNRGKVG